MMLSTEDFTLLYSVGKSMRGPLIDETAEVLTECSPAALPGVTSAVAGNGSAVSSGSGGGEAAVHASWAAKARERQMLAARPAGPSQMGLGFERDPPRLCCGGGLGGRLDLALLFLSTHC